MITMSPERMKSITINIVVISLQRSFRILVSQENLKFQNSTNCDECQRISCDVLSLERIVVSKENNMEVSWLFSAEIHRMSSISLLIRLSWRHSHILIFIEESIWSWRIKERLSSLSKTIDVFVLHVDTNLSVEIRVDEEISSLEDNFVGLLACDHKTKRRYNLYGKCIVCREIRDLIMRIHRAVWDFESGVVCISNLNSKLVLPVHKNLEF